jgi:septum formation protein
MKQFKQLNVIYLFIMKKIILASDSPRRRDILKLTGLKFSVCASAYDEDLDLPLRPRELARYLSRKKAEAVADRHRKAIIIAADTFIVIKDRLIGKPRNENDAVNILNMLNGKAHSVITGFTIIDTESNKTLSRSISTRVFFRRLGKGEINAYVRSREPLDKAGAYAVQGLGAVFVEKIEGDFYNVMGLPLCALTGSLKKFGIHVLK